MKDYIEGIMVMFFLFGGGYAALEIVSVIIGG